MGDTRTFVDPKTGQVTESTWLARWVAALCGSATYFLPAFVLYTSNSRPMWLVVFAWSFAGLGLFFELLARLSPSAWTHVNPAAGIIHNAIARWQHRRRKAKTDASSHP